MRPLSVMEQSAQTTIMNSSENRKLDVDVAE